MSSHLDVQERFSTGEEHRDSFCIPQISLNQTPGVILQQEKQKKNDLPERGTYSRSIQGLLLCISMSVGLGNIWRFPNIAYNHGGAAFLVPYLLLLVIVGRPLYYMELIMGQFSSKGPVKVWQCVPAFKGIGYAQMVSLSFLTIFYNYLMALCVFYMFASMQSCLPWSLCHYSNATLLSNGTALVDGRPPSEHYWLTEVLEVSSEGESPKSISWKIVLCLLGTWTVVYCAILKGAVWLGKLSYFTAVFPYLSLSALLVITCLEDGAVDGIKYFFVPRMEKLLEAKVWYKACEQSFFSLSIGYGNIVMIASYNKFQHNIYRDAMIISFVDTLTNILAGCVMFAILGSLAFKHKKPVSQVLNREGLGLAFIAYPEALERIQYAPQLWSVLFFFTLFTLGVGSSMSAIEAILTAIKDQFPTLRNKKSFLALCACIVFFLLGLPLATNAGQLILLLLDNFGVGAAVFLYCILEIVGVMWIYGFRNFCLDASFMLKRPVGMFWKVTWSFTAPVTLTVIFIYSLFADNLTATESLPSWGVATGWLLACLALLQIPVWFIITLYKDPHNTYVKKLQNIFRPSESWGPKDLALRTQWKALKTPEKNTANIAVMVSPAYVNIGYKEDVF